MDEAGTYRTFRFLFNPPVDESHELYVGLSSQAGLACTNDDGELVGLVFACSPSPAGGRSVHFSKKIVQQAVSAVARTTAVVCYLFHEFYPHLS